MGSRGPESEVHKTTKALSIPGLSEKRFGPPSGMSKFARKTWKQIVNSLPSSHFRPGDIPLLKSYCEACAQEDEATRSIMTEGAVIKISKLIYDSETGQPREVILRTKANPWVAIQTQTRHTMMQLATKLRLCANSRLSNAKAGFEKPESESPSKRRGLMFGGK